MAETFYAEHSGKPYFSDLIDYMTSGDVIALCLARKDGIDFWRYLLGPTRVSEARKLEKRKTIRGIFGDPYNDMYNACHGSDSPESSEREIEIVFPHILYGEGGGLDSAGDSVDFVKQVNIFSLG
jgi:nucleoside-diphosphate kinase